MKPFIKSSSWYIRIIFIWILYLSATFLHSYGQQPVITVRFANPELDCNQETYSVDVEFQSDTSASRLYGMNVRFLYDTELITFQSFFNFSPGYAAVSPNPPNVNQLSSGTGNTLFGFNGEAVYVNGAVQLTNPGATPIFISTTGWTKLFRIRFSIHDLTSPSLSNICPSIVWDLEENPSQGGFAPGSEGVVITIVNPQPNNPSLPVTENVLQFNWEYTQNGGIPYGVSTETWCLENPCGDGSVVILPGETECYESAGSIAVGGNPPSFTIEPDGTAFLVSAVSVTLLPGTYVKEGGYLRAWISDEGCNLYPSMLASTEEELPNMRSDDSLISDSNLFRVFPNPTLGVFNLELLYVCEESTAIAELYNASGTRILQRPLNSNPFHQFDISNMPRGIYIIRVICNERIEVKKVIRN